MAGYETRQGGRQTFATAPVAPAQSRASFSGESAGARVIGGESQGGVVGADITTPGPIGGELGEFFGRIMEPYIQRRQKEGYLKGAVAQMGAAAGEEIRASNGGFSKIFGPTSYESGAIFYSANRAVADLGNELMGDMDELQRMKPSEFAKVIADKVEGLQTGDSFTDQATQAAMFENLGPWVQAHSKANYVWQQKESRKSWADNMNSQSDLLQGGSVTLAKLSDPSDGESTALAQLGDNFAAAAMKPADMDETTYKEAVSDFIRGAAQKGNGHAIKLLMDRGFASVLDEDERQELKDQVLRYGNRATGEAMQDPAIMKMVNDLRVKETLGEYTAEEVSASMEAINQAVRRKTGFDIDIFDWKDVDGSVRSTVAAAKAAYDRGESRRWQIEDREDAKAYAASLKAQAVAQIGTMYGSGDIKVALAAKIGTTADYDLLSMQDYNAGNFAPLVRNYRVGSFVSRLVSDQMQNKVGQSLGEQYTDATKMAHAEWKVMYTTHPAAAAAYYGKYHPMMLNFDNLQGSLGPNLAYQRAFKNPARYSGMQMNPAQRKEATRAITAAVSSEDPWKWVFTDTQLPFQRRGLNAHSQRIMKDVLWDQNTIASQNSSLSMDIITAQSTEQMVRNGRLERYGPLMIQNAPNTKPLGELLHLKTEDADAVVMGIIDAKLKTAGVKSGVYGDEVAVERFKDDKGRPLLFVQSFSDDPAHPTSAYVSWQELWDGKQKHIANRIAKPKRPASHNYNKVDPYRRIPGESTAARLKRINAEVKAGADPVKH